MDQRMPEMDGEEAFRLIRNHKEGPNIETPVICLTADAVVGARERYLSKGFNDYLTKPIDSTSLEKMLKKYLPAEKVLTVSKDELDAAAPAGEKAESKNASIFKMLQSEGIETAKGLSNCAGDEDFYISILLEYLNGAEEKKTNLRSFLDSGDFKDYGILIHSIKSTSAMIGAMGPFKLAQDLEAAASKDDKGFVLSNHDEFLKEYNTVLAALGNIVPDNGSDDDIKFGDDGVMEFLPEGE